MLGEEAHQERSEEDGEVRKMVLGVEPPQKMNDEDEGISSVDTVLLSFISVFHRLFCYRECSN